MPKVQDSVPVPPETLGSLPLSPRARSARILTLSQYHPVISDIKCWTSFKFERCPGCAHLFDELQKLLLLEVEVESGVGVQYFWIHVIHQLHCLLYGS